MTYTKSLDDFKDDLNVHLKQIIKCCHEFDNGERESMLHVTTSLRTLLKNNPPRTISLLHHLGHSDINMVDIAGIGKPSSIVLSPISATGLSLYDYVPNLNIENRMWIMFDDWYNGLVLFYKDKYSFTRKSLIADFGEKYAQHSDKKVPQEMHSLYRNIDDYVGWEMVAGGIKIKQPNIIFSVLRMLCHEVIISLQKHKLSSLDINGLYNAKLRDIKPYSPFGDFSVSLTRKEDVSIEFYCNHKGGIGKLLITGDYSLVNHKENVPDIKKYVFGIVDELISNKVYQFLESGNAIVSEIKEFKVHEFVDIENNKLAVVHKPSQKYQTVEKLLVKFRFSVDIQKIKK